MKILGLIPARAGSERLPGKNTIDLGGHPLIYWSIKTARESGIFDYLVVSTNDPTVKDVAKANHCQVIWRPDGIAQSDTPMLPVVRHAVEERPADVIILLQPTSPFRTALDIQVAHDLLITSGGDAVISVTEPQADCVFELGHAGRLRPAKTVIVENGALYLITYNHLMAAGDWYNGITYAYTMPRSRSVDIDTRLDLEMARTILRQKLAA